MSRKNLLHSLTYYIQTCVKIFYNFANAMLWFEQCSITQYIEAHCVAVSHSCLNLFTLEHHYIDTQEKHTFLCNRIMAGPRLELTFGPQSCSPVSNCTHRDELLNIISKFSLKMMVRMITWIVLSRLAHMFCFAKAFTIWPLQAQTFRCLGYCWRLLCL